MTDNLTNMFSLDIIRKGSGDGNIYSAKKLSARGRTPTVVGRSKLNFMFIVELSTVNLTTVEKLDAENLLLSWGCCYTN